MRAVVFAPDGPTYWVPRPNKAKSDEASIASGFPLRQLLRFLLKPGWGELLKESVGADLKKRSTWGCSGNPMGKSLCHTGRAQTTGQITKETGTWIIQFATYSVKESFEGTSVLRQLTET